MGEELRKHKGHGHTCLPFPFFVLLFFFLPPIRYQCGVWRRQRRFAAVFFNVVNPPPFLFPPPPPTPFNNELNAARIGITRALLRSTHSPFFPPLFFFFFPNPPFPLPSDCVPKTRAIYLNGGRSVRREGRTGMERFFTTNPPHFSFS